MKLSDLVKIGTLGNSIDKEGMIKCNLKADFIEIELRDLFLIFKNNKVRYVSVIKEDNSRYYRILLDDTEVMKEAAEEKGVFIALPQNEIKVFSENYHNNLINYKVFCNNDEIGIVVDELDNSAQTVITIQTKDGKDFMIPVVDKYVTQIDTDNKFIFTKEIEELQTL